MQRSGINPDPTEQTVSFPTEVGIIGGEDDRGNRHYFTPRVKGLNLHGKVSDVDLAIRSTRTWSTVLYPSV